MDEHDIRLALTHLIPNNNGHADLLREYFLALASLTNVEFMGICIPLNNINPVFLSQSILSNIFNAYKKERKMTHDDYVVSIFLASTYQLPSFNHKSPSPEWLWISKLCHLLLYFASHDLPQRIIETATESRKLMDSTQDYHRLWNMLCYKLQGDTLEETFLSFQKTKGVISKEYDSSLTPKFRGMCRTIEFAYHQRKKITRNIVSHSNKIRPITTFHHTDDEGDHLQEARFFSNNSAVDVAAFDLDEPPAFVQLEQTSIQETEKYASIQLYKRTKSKYAHANKNEMLIISDPRSLPLFVARNVLSKLWEYLNRTPTNDKHHSAIVFILLSVYTGRNVRLLTDDIGRNKKQIIRVDLHSDKLYFIINLNITTLKIKSKNIRLALANRLEPVNIPLPKKLYEALANPNRTLPDSNAISTVIAQVKSELHLPYLSLNRIEKILYTTLACTLTNSQIATIVTGRNERKRADIWYSSNDIGNIVSLYRRAINILENNHSSLVGGQDHFQAYAPYQSYHIGSQSTPSFSLVEKFLFHLRAQVIQASNYIDKFNLYNLWLWHICLLLTSVRSVEGAPGFLNQFNLDLGLAWIQDKEERAGSEAQRLVPVCTFLKTAIEDFVKYLEEFDAKYRKLNPNLGNDISDILNSRRPLLNYYNGKGKMTAISPKFIMDTLKTSFAFKTDWPRHLGQKFLHESGVDEAIIMAIFGHEMAGQESHQKFSSLSKGDIIAVKSTYQALADKLRLQHIK